jgi:predicted nucleic acid-binding protein
MNSVFVDTAALIAIGNKDDQYHTEALKIYTDLSNERTIFFTTNAVIFEMANTFSKKQYRSSFLLILNMIKTSPCWNYIIVDDQLMDEGTDLFRDRGDKEWSLVDCIGMVIAEDKNIERIFTTDKHFTQAGFQILLPK